MRNKYIYWYLNFASYINSSTIKKILKTTTYIALFSIVFITSWAVPQEEASANSNWQCNDAYARAYFYKLDWDYSSTSFTIDQYVATETTTIQRTTVTVDFSSTSNIAGTVKGINALAMSPTGVMYVTITSDGHGTHLFTINRDTTTSTTATLTPLAHIADYQQVGDNNFYSGVNGYYGFSSGDYVVNANGNDQIYMAQAGFEHGYIYNVATGGVTTFSDPGMVTPINAADFSYIGSWDGYEIATYNALANKVILYDKDNNTISEVTPTNSAFSNVSATLASYSYKTPEGEIRFIIDDGLGNRFEVKRVGTNSYTVEQKGTTFTTDNSDGASCGPNAYDPFGPTFKTSLGTCASGYQQPSLLITNNRGTTQYFDVQYRISGGSWVDLLNGEEITPNGQFPASGIPQVYNGQTVEFQMRYGSSNPSSGDFYTVGDLLTGSGCGDYAAGTVSTSAGTCDGGSSTPSVTLTNTGTVTTYFDVQYKIGNGSWTTFIDGEAVSAGSPETISMPVSVINGQQVQFQYLFANANPTATTGFTAATSRTIDCPTYSATITATPGASCTNDFLYHTVTVNNTGNTTMWFAVAERDYRGNANFDWIDSQRQIPAGESAVWTSRIVYNGTTPEYKMVYGTYRYQYQATDLSNSGHTEGTFTQRQNGSYLKSGDSWVRWTANSPVDCDWWGNGGYGTNSSNNYSLVSQSTSQICDGSGNATIRLTVTNFNASNDAYAGFIDVQWSTNNTNWVDVVDGRAIADGESITFESPEQIASSSTGYFRYRIAATNPTDSTTNASWAVFSRQANCIANYTQSASFSECSASGQYSTLSITNNESQTLYFRAVPTRNDTTYDYSTSALQNYDFNSEAITFSVPANSTLTYDASNSPNMRKLYPDGAYGYMQWIVQGSYIETPDWTNTTAYPYKLTNGQLHQCTPNVTASYDVTACSSAGQTSTLTITNNESQTIYFKVNPSRTASTLSTSSTYSPNYNTADATTFSVAANTTFEYTAGAVTYGVNEDAYMFWRIQKSYSENPTWNTQAYPYQYLSSPTSGLSYQHDCDLNVDPYSNSSYQYETRPSNEQNSCVDNKQWMGWVLYNQNYNDANRTSLWYAFEVSIDNGANFNTNNLFYRMDDTYSDNDYWSVSNGSGSLSADGYTAVQATNNLNMANSSNNRYIYLSTRAVSGSIMKIRYKVAYAENELGTTEWITLGNYNKTTEQRTTDCEPEINSSGWGTTTTTDSANDTFSDLVTIGECQNTIETGGFALSTLTLTRPSGVQYYLKLWQSTDSGSNWTPIETNYAMGTTYTKELTVNHAGKIKYKFQFSYISGDFSNSNTYYSAEKTVNCPTVGASTASIALGTCVTGGATPTITIGNNGWATGYFHIQYSTDLGQNYTDAFYDPNNGNATLYQMILPGEVKTYTIQDTIPQGTTVVMQYRYAASSPPTGAFTTTNTVLIDCSSDVSSVTFEQNTTPENCFNGSQQLKIIYTNSSSTTNYFYYKINKNSQGYDTNWSVATLNANTSNGTVILPESYGDNDTVLIKYHIESTEGGSYGTEVINDLITIDCGTEDFFTISTDYVSCNLYGADKLEFKFQRNSTSASFLYNAYIHIEAEISHDGNIWKPLGRMQYSNQSTNSWFSSSGTKGNLYDTYPTYWGYIQPYNFSNGHHISGVILTDSAHQYQIRYRTYTSTTNNLTMGNFTGVFTTLTIPADTNCDQNDVEPVTLTTTQLTCLENKGQVEFTFNDTTVTHLDPYQPARLFYQYSTNGGVTWSKHIDQRAALSNTTTINLPSVKVTNGTVLQMKWGYVRDHTMPYTSNSYTTYHNTYSSSNLNARQFDYIGGLTSTGSYYEHYRVDDSSNNFNANFMSHNMVNTTEVSVDCDPDSTYSQTLTTCECNDLGATSTLAITNNDNYTSYYKVEYKIGNGQWVSATDSLESAFDISVSGGATNDTLSKFVPDGETIQWRIKDTTNGGDFDGQEWEEVTASATIDCGCAGGSVDINVDSTTCGNGSSTPIINLVPSSSDTAYFTVQYKRNTDTDWVTFKTAESVTNGQTENHTMQVTVVHQGTIQIRYKVNKILSNLNAQEWNYTDTKTINCPYSLVTVEAQYSSCGSNFRAATFKVTNTGASTSAAKFRVQYKIVTPTTTVTDWTNSSLIDTVVAPGASQVTSDNIQITEGQKIIWRYESVNTSADFLNNWTEDDTSGYVNCVINVTVTNSMGSCDNGSQTATLNVTNDETNNTVYFRVHYKTGNTWILKDANLEVGSSFTNRTLTVDVPHDKNIQWKYQVSNTPNDYANAEVVELTASATVDCVILDATGSSAFGSCISGQRRSTFTMQNSSSANDGAYFYVQYDLSGDNQSWQYHTSGQANFVGVGAQNVIHQSVPNGETIQWRYYPMTTATAPAESDWINESTQTPEDCSLDTLISHTLDTCISNSQVSNFVLTNNTAGDVHYHVQYFIEGTSAYADADNDLILSAGSPQGFTQTVASGKYIQWRYKAATSNAGLASATWVDHTANSEFKKTINCENIDPSVVQSFGLCYNDTKNVKFIIKNSSSATTSAYFKVQYKIGSGEWIDKSDQEISIGGQFSHSQNVPAGQTIQWQYKVAKTQADLPTGWTTLNATTITCNGEDISITMDPACDGNGYKTSKLNIFNSSSGNLYYQAQYTFEGANSNNWTTAAEQVVVSTGNSTFVPISVQQGQAITWRYKVSETGNDFDSLTWTTPPTSEVVDCTGVSISTPYTSLSQCVSGAKTSTFNYSTLSNSANAAYFHIQYRIDGGAWINKVTSSDGTLAAGQSNSVTQSVTSGSTIEWQYKAAYNTTALTNASFISLAAGAEEVDCGVQLTVSHGFSTCTNQTATSTLLLKNTGATPMLVTVQSKLNTGDWATEVSTFEITAGNEISLDKTIVSGQTISWKYKYAGTVVKLTSASETTMDTIPALDCETPILNQVAVSNVLKECVAGKRISELTFTNNSNETVYVEALYDTGSGYLLKGTYSVTNGTPRVLESPSVLSGSSVKWKYRLGLSSTLTGNYTELEALSVSCIQTSDVTAAFDACTNLTRDSRVTIKNTGSLTQYYQLFYSISGGSYQFLTEVTVGVNQENTSNYQNLTSGQYINWKWKSSIVQGDFANSQDNFLTRSTSVNCIDDSLSASATPTCTPNGATSTKTSGFTITSSSTDSKQVEVQYSTDSATYLSMGTHTVSSLQPYVDSRPFTTNYYTYRYRISGTTNWSQPVVSVAPSDCSIVTNVISAYNTNECVDGSSFAKLSIVNPGQVATVIYDININNAGWQSVGSPSVNGTYTSPGGVKIPANTPFQWRYKLATDTDYKFVPGTGNDCSQANAITAVTEIICPADNSSKSAKLRIINVGPQSVSAMYNYSINNGPTQSGPAPVSINPTSSNYSIEVPLNDGDQIVFEYKLTSDASYQQTPSKSTSECGDGLISNPQLIQTISECTESAAVSTVEMRNLSDQVKTFYLEYKLNNGPWTNYDTVTVNASSPVTRKLTVSDNTTIQWRAVENSFTQFDLNSPYQLSQAETVICQSVTTTTLPPVKYIFEPIVSTNRVCDFEDGGAEFGITVDNSRSNVSAKVLKKIWINTTLIAQETVNVPAGQTIDFSSIEVGENKFFTVALEVTNNENGKVQKMIKNKDADCIEDERPINEEQNPIDEVEVTENTDNVMEGDGDDQEMEDNGESLLFLPGDDFVEFVYIEDASNPFTPQFTDDSPPTPGIPFTGRNVGGLIISFGLMLIGFGAFILRRAFKF